MKYQKKSPAEIQDRIEELEYEWDTERVLEMNFAGIVVLSSILGYVQSKRWLLLSGIAGVYMIQHILYKAGAHHYQ